ncbi:hypothetical protein [Oleiharenicola lentus]|uniref:hypothetical protein n=1 Tax=Oleiharenicola lentus TaxID=2508720 RepID=UPI003F673877
MSQASKAKIRVQGTDVTILAYAQGDFISLTDMVKPFEGGSALSEQWLKTKISSPSLAFGSASITRILIPSNSRELTARPDGIASFSRPSDGLNAPAPNTDSTRQERVLAFLRAQALPAANHPLLRLSSAQGDSPNTENFDRYFSSFFTGLVQSRRLSN